MDYYHENDDFRDFSYWERCEKYMDLGIPDIDVKKYIDDETCVEWESECRRKSACQNKKAQQNKVYWIKEDYTNPLEILAKILVRKQMENGKEEGEELNQIKKFLLQSHLDVRCRNDFNDYMLFLLSPLGIQEFISDVEDYCDLEVNFQRKKEIKFLVKKPVGITGTYLNYREDFILPFTPICEDASKVVWGKKKRVYYEPDFCKGFYNMLFGNRDNLQIFKATREYHLEGVEVVKTRSYNPALYLPEKMLAFIDSSSVRLGAQDSWMFEKTTGFNIAYAIYCAVRSRALTEKDKLYVQELIKCKPLQIRAKLAYLLFGQVLAPIKVENEVSVKKLKQMIDRINFTFKFLCQCYSPWYNVELHERGIERQIIEDEIVREAMKDIKESESVHTSSEDMEDGVKEYNRRLLIYDSHFRERLPSDANMSGSEARAFSWLQYLIIGESMLNK